MFKTLFIAGVLFTMVPLVGCGGSGSGDEPSLKSDADFQREVDAYEKAMASDP
ncbi:hypothetical protein [Novipirellula rosea]|uniref:Secreted protein n=1 Tax=Novipirellula rosea TaxID=1031540 RepID=A0ABP8MJ98_9BACT|tara:strand:- start:7865 stop:8023 length:159 start_codon:yes stop_codon:yes gene_type:complete